MEKEERLIALRRRFKPKPLAPKQAPVGIARAKGKSTVIHPIRVWNVVFPKASGTGFVSCGPLIPREPPVWVQTPDDHPSCTVPKIANRQGISPLIRIAQKLPTKRPRS